MITTIVTALILALGLGGVAVGSDNARPGDALFGVDQAVEQIRLSLAGEERRNELRIEFVDERLHEVDELVKEDNERRLSDDKGNDSDLSDDTREKVTSGVENAMRTLSGVSSNLSNEIARARLTEIVRRLNERIDALPSDVRTELSDDRLRTEFDRDDDSDGDTNDDRGVDIRFDIDRPRVEVRESDDSDRKSSDDASQSDTVRSLEVEAHIFTDMTVIKVEFNNQKTTFTITDRTREAVIDEVTRRFSSLSRPAVEAALSLETENRSSRPEDIEKE